MEKWKSEGGLEKVKQAKKEAKKADKAAASGKSPTKSKAGPKSKTKGKCKACKGKQPLLEYCRECKTIYSHYLGKRVPITDENTEEDEKYVPRSSSRRAKKVMKLEDSDSD